MSKKMRMLQILNLWRLIPAYLIVYVSNNKAIRDKYKRKANRK